MNAILELYLVKEFTYLRGGIFARTDCATSCCQAQTWGDDIFDKLEELQIEREIYESAAKTAY